MDVGDLDTYRAQILRDLDVFASEVQHRIGLHASLAAWFAGTSRAARNSMPRSCDNGLSIVGVQKKS
jgi:hypothetical protein